MSVGTLGTKEVGIQQFAKTALKPDHGETGGGGRRDTRRPFPLSIPLLAVLAAQAVLSLRLMWSKTAFNDEALYLWAGHLELGHLLHGTPVPTFQTYFSGAPVIYPPLGALADSLGGLAAARALSLGFMLGATLLLYSATRRLFGGRAGEIAAGSFGVLGSAQFLGAFATYDALALFLLGLAAWLVVMACGRLSEPLLITAGLVLALADATKYPTTLWDPVVVALAALTATRGGWLRRGARAMRLALYSSAVILVALLRFGGHAYLQGIMFTTLARSSNAVPSGSIVRDSALWIGLILVIALRGMVIAESTRARLICATLACAVVLAPLEQARIHTLTSLDKHVTFGAWFGAIAVGYVLARALETSHFWGWRIPGRHHRPYCVHGHPAGIQFLRVLAEHGRRDGRHAATGRSRPQGADFRGTGPGSGLLPRFFAPAADEQRGWRSGTGIRCRTGKKTARPRTWGLSGTTTSRSLSLTSPSLPGGRSIRRCLLLCAQRGISPRRVHTLDRQVRERGF